MKHYLVTLLFVYLVGISTGEVFVQTCDPNNLSTRSYNQLMVGHTVSLVVAADANDLWSGGLFLRGENRGMGILSGRDNDPNTRNQEKSCLKDAGYEAFVSEWKDSAIWGFDLYNDVTRTKTGDWFVIDYTATETGFARIEFYDYTRDPNDMSDPNDNPWEVPDPNKSIEIIQIPTRDFNNDGTVNLIDFNIFSRHWEAAYQNPNDFENTDITGDGYVGLADLVAFSDYWLWPIVPEPVVVPEPNLFYSVADANGLSEITMTVGDSRFLYIDQNSLLSNEEIFYYDLEVDISDPNLGVIDGDPNYPSAIILTTPRITTFDYIAPGFMQPEGIEFFAAYLGAGGISDGPQVEFIYTATGVGDVTLYLIDYSGYNTGLIPLLIHQVAPPVDTVQVLEEIWESGELSGTTSEEEWNSFITSVKESQTNDPNSVSQ